MRIRITPACAGKRVCIPMRSCGGGIAPRVRGKAPPWTTRGFRCRITPACAGKSTQRNQVTSHQKDHPRVCGEKVVGLVDDVPQGRITPACAGKREAQRMQNLLDQGSPPRVRGKD